MSFQTHVALRHLSRYVLLLALLLTTIGTAAPAAHAADPPFTVYQEVILLEGDPDQPIIVTELTPGVRALARTVVTNNSAEVAAYTLEWPEFGYNDAEAEPTPEFPQIFRLAPGEARRFERAIPPASDTEAFFAGEPAETTFTSMVIVCAHPSPESLQRPCPNPPTAPGQAVRHVLALPVRAADLGDAPDSSNHFGVPMAAYPGVQANFPTVFDPATGTPSGPRHLRPQPFHLGPRVSLEVGADIGPDQDPRNNIVPLADSANNDRADDGIRIDPQSLAHCRPATVAVSVFITPAFQAAAFAAGVEQGYLNLWLDGNRDGDWADRVECPQAANLPGVALEHILIDHPIALASLTPGLNSFTVTTGRVPWPAEQKERPSWLRATLSLTPAEKPFQAGAISFGDGRGPVGAQGAPLPFRHGETEDYLINRPAAALEADVEVRKEGRVVYDEASGRRVAVWAIGYRNSGDAPARNVVLRDELVGDLNIIAILIGVRSAPEVPYTPDGDGLRFAIGDLAPGEGGRILIRTELPPDEANLTSLANMASVRADNDADPSNNSARAVIRLGLQAPVIVTPASGITCGPEVIFSGLAAPGATVTLFNLDDQPIIDTTANAEGRWRVPAELPAGRNSVYAVAELGERTSTPSMPVRIIVDPSLPFDPLSMGFVEQDTTHSLRPLSRDGFLGADGWYIRLKPNTTYSFSVRSCCATPGAQLALKLGNAAPIALEQVGATQIYRARFTTGPAGGAVRFAVLVRCGDVDSEHPGAVEPMTSGLVVDARSRAPIAGATVALYQVVAESTGRTRVLYTADDLINPTRTDAEGNFDLPVLPDRYYLAVSAPGYQSFVGAYSGAGRTHLDTPIRLRPLPEGPPTERVVMDATGFTSRLLRVRPGATVEFVNLDLWEHTIVAPRDPASGQATGKRSTLAQEEPFDSGLIAPGASYTVTFAEAGTYTIGDGAAENNPLTVIVAADAGGFQVFLPLLRR
jgi:hypothetical protein